MSNSPSLAAAELIGQFGKLADKIDALAEVSAFVKQAGCADKVHKLVDDLRRLPEDQLVSLHVQMSFVPGWPQFSLVVDELIPKVKQVNCALEPFMPEPEFFRAVCQPSACTDGPSQVDVDDILIALASEQIAVTIAQGIVDAIPQTVSVPIIGDVPNPAYYIALAAKVALELAANGTNLAAAILQRAADVRAACEEDAFQQVVFNMCATLNEIKSSLDSLHNKVDLLDKKVNILLTLVVELTRLTQTLYLFEIEKALMECSPLVSLYLPDEVNGKLIEVQNLVESLISAADTSGLYTNSAISYLKQGLAATNNRDFCTALGWFKQAYQELIQAQCCLKDCLATKE